MPEPPQFWRYVLWIVLVALLASYFFRPSVDQPREALSYSEFKARVRADDVAAVTLRGQQVQGEFTRAPGAATGATEPNRFQTTLPPVDDPQLLPLLEQHGVRITARTEDPPWLLQVLLAILPWVLLVALFFYISRRFQQRMLQGPGGEIFGFGKSRAKRYREGTSHTGFADVAGLESAKQDLLDVIAFLKEPERLRKLGAKPPRGILLMGPPGTGKTLLARAVAGEAEVPFFSISGSEFVEVFVGVGASRVRDMFEAAKKEAPAIIFIDEIDSVGRARGTGLGGSHDEREQTLNQILNEMDGFAAHEAVIVLAATNRPDVLDPALLRPGRFDRKVVLELPRKAARHEILQVHARGIPLAEDVDLEQLAARTVGFSGADLENLMNEAALLAGRLERNDVDAGIIDQAREKIVLGAARESLLDEQEKERVAYHESGHALLTCLLEHTDPVTKVTIIPHGLALGVTEQTPVEDRYNLMESYLRDRITVMLGGRIAEQQVFGEVSSGAEDDIKQATELARRMVSQWGMSETLGPVAFRRGEEHVFLGREMAQARDFSEHTAQLIDDEVRALIGELEDKAEELISSHRDALDRLAQGLREREVLDADEIHRLVGVSKAA